MLDKAGPSTGLVDWRRQARREIVSISHRNFAPIGLLTPVMIRLKILLQKSSKIGVEWDQPLQDELTKETRTILGEIVALREGLYPRRPKPASQPAGELCGWWSGGELVVAACLYSRYELEETGSRSETHICKLLMGKARVAPSSEIEETLPQSTQRTEMAGLVLLARSTTSILEGLSNLPTRIMLFGDSERAVSTMETAGERDVRFSHRIAEVHEHVASWRRRGIEVDQLHHWPAGSNPAGIAGEG